MKVTTLLFLNYIYAFVQWMWYLQPIMDIIVPQQPFSYGVTKVITNLRAKLEVFSFYNNYQS